MATHEGLATLYSAHSFADGLDRVLKVRRIKMLQSDVPEEVLAGINVCREVAQAIQMRGYFTLDDYRNIAQSRGLEYDFLVPHVRQLYQNDSIHPNDRGRFNFWLSEYFQGSFGNRSDVLMWVGLSNYHFPLLSENYVASYAIEELFRIWAPKFAWLAADLSLDSDYVAAQYPPLVADLKLKTPWHVYSETLIYGPELVQSLGLKHIDWAATDVFFYKWVTDNILWLASPEGPRSVVNRVPDHEVDQLRTRHVLALEKLGLIKSRGGYIFP